MSRSPLCLLKLKCLQPYFYTKFAYTQSNAMYSSLEASNAAINAQTLRIHIYGPHYITRYSLIQLNELEHWGNVFPLFDTAATGTVSHGVNVYVDNLPGHIRSHHFHKRCLAWFLFSTGRTACCPGGINSRTECHTDNVAGRTLHPIGTQSELTGIMAVCRGFFLSHLIVMTVPSKIRLAVKKHTTRGEDRHLTQDCTRANVYMCVYLCVHMCFCCRACMRVCNCV